MKIGILILSATLILSTQSQQKPLEQSGGRGQKSGSQKELPKPDSPSVTTPASTITNPNAASQNQEKAAHASQSEKKNASFDWVAVFTGVLAFFALLQVGTLVWQILTARDYSRRQLRAYVGVSESLITLGNPPYGMVEIKNGGQTPAYNVRQWVGIAINMRPLVGELPASQQEEGSVSSILPNAVHTLRVPLKKPLEPQHEAIFGTEKCTPYVYGKIIYQDIYGNEWTTGFRFFYNGVKGNRVSSSGVVTIVGLMHPDKTGNDAK